MTQIPRVQTWGIDTTPAHLEGFAHRHAMEFDRRTITSLGGTKFLFSGEQGMEMYELENPIFGKRPVIIDVTSIKKLLARRLVPYQMIRLDLTQEWADYIAETCNVEEAGIERHTVESVRRPGIILEWAHGHTSTIDGSHRLVKSWRLGLKSFEMAMVMAPFIINHTCRPGAEENLFKYARSLNDACEKEDRRV